jgi:hypothetical protein
MLRMRYRHPGGHWNVVPRNAVTFLEQEILWDFFVPMTLGNFVSQRGIPRRSAPSWRATRRGMAPSECRVGQMCISTFDRRTATYGAVKNKEYAKGNILRIKLLRK